MLELMYRYASEEMRNLWSENNKISTYRRVWTALAESQMECGISRVKKEHIEQLNKHIDSHVDDPKQIQRLSQIERECKHDIVAHIRLLGELCPEAKEIIHLGATSCDITDNADLLIIKDSMEIILKRLVGAIGSLAVIAEVYTDTPCLAYTHYQPAQLTTIGKRVCLWLSDFVSDLEELKRRMNSLKLHGLKGATGTQDSYVKLGSHYKVTAKQIEDVFAKKFDMDVYPIMGQTYSRKIDSQTLNVLACIGQTAHKFGTDLRLLQHDHEMHEMFSDKQVGSSAMTYKCNPHKCERLCSLSRYLVNEAHNAENTAMLQWLERTLDDSAGRRLYLPTTFMAADAVLRLVGAIAYGLHINTKAIEKHVQNEMPFILTEPLLVEASAKGGNRDDLYNILRDLCQEAKKTMHDGNSNPLLYELSKREEFKDILPRLDRNPKRYTGNCTEQVKSFIENVIKPIRMEYPKYVEQFMEIIEV